MLLVTSSHFSSLETDYESPVGTQGEGKENLQSNSISKALPLLPLTSVASEIVLASDGPKSMALNLESDGLLTPNPCTIHLLVFLYSCFVHKFY